MQLRYGSYAHDANEVEVSISRRTEYGPRGAFKVTETWTCTGRKIAATQSELTAKLQALENAYSWAGLGVVLLDNSGFATVHQINNSRTLGGVKITQPISYPDGKNAQYSTYRDYTFTLEADFPLVGLLGNLSEYQETVSFEGGGPTRVVIELDSGMPIEQITRDQTAYRASQSGRLMSLVENPQPPRPLWPAKLQGSPRITRGTPVETNGGCGS